MNRAFLEYYHCPEKFADFRLDPQRQDGAEPGYFSFGPGNILHGKVGSEGRESAAGLLADAATRVRIEGRACILPFDPTEVANNLRLERYMDRAAKPVWKRAVRGLYYALRPAFPVSFRRHLQKAWLKGWDKTPFPRWPVDRSVDQMFATLMRFALQASGEARIPFIWFWPEGKSSCAVMDINDSYGIKSSFQLIPDARYVVSDDDLAAIKGRGFEANVHDLKHDGHLYDSHEKFEESAARINQFGERFGSKGFRSAVLYRNQEWFGALKFSYDMSVPNVAHLDPQRGGCCTVMPYFVGDLLEIPVTATQDYTLFHVLGTHLHDLWQKQISQIMEQHGLISFIVHPDYLDTEDALKSYKALLAHLSELRAQAAVWIALPGEVDTWWRHRSEMKLVAEGAGWRVEGPEAERATVAYATLKDDKLAYQFV